MAKYELEGRRALVTGSSAGIGRAIALELAAQGVSIVVHGRSSERAERTAAAIRERGGTAALAIGDLGDPVQAEAVGDAADAAFGGIDILVNNAGNRDYSSWEANTPDRWAERFSANCFGPLRLVYRLTPGMQRQGWGRLIQIGSIAGIMPGHEYADYSASKAALNNLTTTMARRFAAEGITSNLINVGMIKTESSQILERVMQEEVLSAAEAEQRIAGDLMRVPARRMGRPEEVAHLVSFLASPLAGYLNGASIRLDGGWVPVISI